MCVYGLEILFLNIKMSRITAIKFLKIYYLKKDYISFKISLIWLIIKIFRFQIKMFWGCAIKANTPYNFKDEVSPLLHLSNATLTPQAKGG